MSLSSPFIERPVATTLLTIAVGLAGAVAYLFLPVSPLPQVDFPTISVSAALPGASPETMASAVATPLERQFGRIAGVTEMTSTSYLGQTSITMQFDLNRNIDAAARDVQASINAAAGYLPSNLPSKPTWRKVNPADAPIMILAVTSHTYTKARMYDEASSIIQQKLSQLKGVGQVIVGGGALPAVRIDINPTRLNYMGLTLEDVRTALGNVNVNRPKGQVSDDVRTVGLATTDQLFTAAEYKPLIIAYQNGRPVTLSDIADVTDNVEDIRTAGILTEMPTTGNGGSGAGNRPVAKPQAAGEVPKGAATVDDEGGAKEAKVGSATHPTSQPAEEPEVKPAVLLIVFRQPGANIIETVDRISAAMPQLQAEIPAGMRLSVVMDRTATIRASVKDVQYTLLLSICLVIMVVFVFLRDVRSTLIPSVAVPVSLIGTFGVMYLLGYSIDNLSLMAMTIATGFVVDDAIVVIENITRHLEQGMQPKAAALLGAKEIGFTVLSISVSLVAVFIPILLMGGIVGRLFREFAVTLSVAIGVSMIVSLTTTPMMCATLLKHRSEERHGRLYNASEKIFDWILGFYHWSLSGVLRHPFVTLIVWVLTLGLTVFLYIVVPKGFFPQQDTGRLTGSIVADQATSYQLMSKLLEQYSKVVAEDPGVDNVIAFCGGQGGNGGSNTGRMFVALKPIEQRKIGADDVIARIRKKANAVPGANFVLQSVQDLRIGGRASAAQYQYTLQGDDLNELNSWAPQVLAKVKTLPGLVDVTSDQQDRGLQASLIYDRPTASRLGISAQKLDDTQYDAFGQRQVSTTYTQLNQYHVVMEVAPSFWQTPDGLKSIYIRSSTGGLVPLSAVAHYAPTNTSLAVNHQGVFPAVTISFNLKPGVSLGDAVYNIQQAGHDMGLPASIHGKFAGTAQAFQDSLSNELILILAALGAVYIVLGVLYESYIHPITIISTLPSAGVGALLALMLTGTDLSVIAIIGIILLIGIVKKNAIMMIDFALEAERGQHIPPADAIFQACILRFRPIMMTTLAALFGGIPLALGTGTGAELRKPLGIAIVGGLIFSQMLTLYTTPVVYLYLDRMRLWFDNLRYSPAYQPHAPPRAVLPV
jgi:multidrug efflux pump